MTTYPTPTAEQAAEATRLRLAAAAGRARAAESFERSDTDGFLTQGAAESMAALHDEQAEILEHGGTSRFPALFDLAGRLVPAKPVRTRHGTAWALLAGDDPRGPLTGRFLAFHPARRETLARHGFTEGWVLAGAWARLDDTGRFPVRYRTDGGYSPTVTILTTDRFTDPEEHTA